MEIPDLDRDFDFDLDFLFSGSESELELPPLKVMGGNYKPNRCKTY